MEENIKEKETPEIPEEEKTSEPDERDEQIKSLSAQKEHFREKAQKAEEAQKLAQEEAERLKTELETKSSALSEKELKEKYPDFEYMDEAEKAKAQTELEREKRLKILEAKDKWREDYRMLPKETREKLEKKGGEEAFKDFACSPENCGQKNLLNLAKQFLYEEMEVPVPEEPEKKPGLEPGIGGLKTSITPKKGYTAEQAAELRKRDSAKYNKLVSEGRMKIID